MLPLDSLDSCDLLIEGGTVVDGSGAPRFAGSVAVADGRIVGLGELPGMSAHERIDAGGLVVAPGFIDAHTHDDRLVLSSPDMTPKISQGVTTVIAGNCGVSLAPLRLDRAPPPPMNLLGGRDWYRFGSLGDYAAAVEADPPAVNLAALVGHSTLRAGAMADLGAAATAREIGRMGDGLAAALEEGAIGLSTGLAYPTASAAPPDEVTALARRLVPYGAVYTTHMRDEGDHLIEAVEEALGTGRSAGVRVVISHHKATGRENWGRTEQSLALIEAARRSQAVDFDVYPYTAGSTVLIADWIERCEKVLVTWSEAAPEQAGRDLADIAADWGCSLRQAADRLQPAGAIYFQMDEADLQRVLAHPRAMVGSDGLPHDARPHPRLWGTFPRVLGRYCRELGLFSLEEAVHRMTGVAAEVFGLADRGILREGAAADLVIFDPETVIDRADFDDPMQPAAGIRRVIVNGEPVWDGEAWTGRRPGRFLRRGKGGNRLAG